MHPSAYRVMARTRIFTWANQAYYFDPLGVKLFGVKCVTTPKRHIYTSWGSYMCNTKRILQAVTELRAGQEYNLDPLGDKVMGQMSHFPQKAHLDPLGVLHVQYVKNPPSGYRVMARTRIFTWANKHITLTPWGSSFSGSNMSQPQKAHLHLLGVLHVQYEKNPP